MTVEGSQLTVCWMQTFLGEHQLSKGNFCPPFSLGMKAPCMKLAKAWMLKPVKGFPDILSWFEKS